MPPYPPTPPRKKKKEKALLITLPLVPLACSLSGFFCANANFTLFDGLQITGFLAQQKLQATATYYAVHYPFGTKMLFQDDLSSPSGKWKTSANCANQGGALHVTEAQSGKFSACLSTYSPFEERQSAYTYEVTMKDMKASAAGLVFRGKETAEYDTYDFFLVSSDGTYTLSFYESDLSNNYVVIKSGKLTGQPTLPLRVGVVVVDKQSIGLYVNSKEVVQVSDNDFVASGSLGVAVFNQQKTQPASADFVRATCWAHESDL
jgi:hypothetical protein